MARSTHRRLGAATVVGAVLAVSAPAIAVTPVCTTTTVTTCIAGVPVTLTSLGGTRQFAVEDASGLELTGLDLGTGGSQPFRTHVTDTGFTAVDKGFRVDATMTNLYLQNTGGHNFTTKVPSSDVSITFGANPLASLGLSLVDMPKLSAAGTIAPCTSLTGSLASALGLVGGLVPVGNLQLADLCTKIGAVADPVNVTLDSASKTLTPAVASLLDLPVALSVPTVGGALGGAFATPTYAAGTVGAGDTAGAAAAAGSTPTAIPVMKGTPGMTAALATLIKNLLTSSIGSLPLVASTGSTQTTVTEVVNELSNSSDSVTAALGAVLNTLSLSNQVTAITSLLTSTINTPLLTDLASITSNAYSFPVLRAVAPTAQAGTYDGTLVLTFVQD